MWVRMVSQPRILRLWRRVRLSSLSVTLRRVAGSLVLSLLLMLFPLRRVMGAVLRGMMLVRVWGR